MTIYVLLQEGFGVDAVVYGYSRNERHITALMQDQHEGIVSEGKNYKRGYSKGRLAIDYYHREPDRSDGTWIGSLKVIEVMGV